MKHINDLHQRLQLLESAVESMSSESVSTTVSTVQKETADIAVSLKALQILKCDNTLEQLTMRHSICVEITSESEFASEGR